MGIQASRNSLRTGRGADLGFCYDVDRTLFAGSGVLSDGPLLVALDTNVVLDLQDWGADLINGDVLDLQDDKYVSELEALGHVIDLWFTRDIRFVVMRQSRRDQGRSFGSALIAHRDETLDAIEQALSFQIEDWGTENERHTRVRALSVDARRLLENVPGELDRLLLAEAAGLGADVFLTRTRRS